MAVEATRANPFEDSRSNEELFAAALQGEYDDELPWEAVRNLRWRGTIEVFELAKKYATSPVAKERGRALDVLAQLGAAKPDSERPYKPESVSIAARLATDSDPHVVHQAAYALAHLGGNEATSTLISMKRSSNPGIRNAVALGLHGVTTQEAIETLIELMEDEDDDVRDWATFALGQGYPPADAPEIRDALRKRLDDTYEDARAEAIWGLAIRKDPQGLELLLERLETEEWTSGDETAAEETLDLRGEVDIEVLRAGIRKLLAGSD